MSRTGLRFVLAAAAVGLVTAAVVSAQAPTTTTETKAFEVIAVDGNALVVKLPEGTKELTVPEDFRFTVDGQQLSVRELKPGMKGTAVVTTKTTMHPVTVTEVKEGTVRQVSGSSMIVQTPEGFKMFTQSEVDKRAVKIMRHGEPAQVSEFHTGDKLTATIITSKPPRVVTEKEVNATLAAQGGAPAAQKPAATSGAAPAASAAPPAAPASAGETAGAPAAAKALPKTASSLPLVGVVGIGAILAAAALALRRRRAAL